MGCFFPLKGKKIPNLTKGFQILVENLIRSAFLQDLIKPRRL